MAFAMSCFLPFTWSKSAEPTAQGLAPGQFIWLISNWYLTSPPVLGGAIGLLVLGEVWADYSVILVTLHIFWSLSVSEGSQKKGEAESRIWAGWICSGPTFLEVHFGMAAASNLSELNPGLNNWYICEGQSVWSGERVGVVSSAPNHRSVLSRERASLPDRDT